MNEIEQLKAQNQKLKAELAQRDKMLAQLRTMMKTQSRELELLRELDRGMAPNEAMADMLTFALDWSLNRTSSDHGIIIRWRKERQLFEAMHSSGFPLGRAYQPGITVHLPTHLTPQEKVASHARDIYFTKDDTCMVAALRVGEGQLVGALLLQRADPNKRFTAGEKAFIQHVADRLAIYVNQALLLDWVQSLNQHRSQLFRMLSHDLRQPLTVLVGYIQLVQMAMTQENHDVMEEYLNHIANGAKDLSSLLEEVLLMERAANTSRAEWEVISFKDLINKALEKHRSEAKLKAHSIETHFSDEKALCKGMQVELREAAANIIGNAIKYTPDGGIIKIKLAVPDGKIRFSVQDNGYGIEEARQKRLFEPFYRAQQPGTTHIKGTGLGLNLVKSIVQKHDGDVFFTSVLGEGSTFGFWLPLHQSEETPEPTAS